MTQKEINEFLDNTKVYVNGKSKEIQEKLFSLGYSWNDGYKKVKHTEEPFLFIYTDNMSFTRSCDMELFCNHNNREITVEEILSLELTEPAYRPFKNKDECWSEMMKHQPFGWVFSKNKEDLIFVYFICATYIRVHEGYSINDWTFDYEEIFNKYTFADGTPFGIKKE